MRRPAIVLSLLLLCATAHAEKKRQTATILSATGSAVSSGLVLAGFLTNEQGKPFNLPILYTGLGAAVFTPSLGEWYAGEWLTIGMAVRVGAVGLATYAVTHEVADVTCQTAAQLGQTCQQITGTGVALIGLAAIAFIGGIAYDVQAAPDAVDDWNKRHGFVVTPTVVPSASGGAPGASLVATF